MGAWSQLLPLRYPKCLEEKSLPLLDKGCQHGTLCSEAMPCTTLLMYLGDQLSPTAPAGKRINELVGLTEDTSPKQQDTLTYSQRYKEPRAPSTLWNRIPAWQEQKAGHKNSLPVKSIPRVAGYTPQSACCQNSAATGISHSSDGVCPTHPVAPIVYLLSGLFSQSRWVHCFCFFFLFVPG